MDKQLFEIMKDAGFNDTFADFLDYSKHYVDSNINWASKIVKSGMICEGRFIDTEWIMNHENHSYMDAKLTFNEVAEKANSYSGYIVEVCAGPAGGFAPAILTKNHDAYVIVSDINAIIAKEWYKLIHHLKYPNTTAMAFNICDMPFRDGTIDVVSSRNGFVNIESGTGSHEHALREVFRVLKDGGMFIMDEIVLSQECINQLQDNHLLILSAKYPHLFSDFRQECTQVGFKNVSDKIYSTWSNADDQSDLATLCKRLGVVLHFNTYLRFCIK